MLGGAGTEDDGTYLALMQEPSQGKVGHRCAEACGDLSNAINRGEGEGFIAFSAVTAHLRIVGEVTGASARVGDFAGVGKASGEEALLNGAVAEDAHVVRFAGIGDLILVGSPEEVVGELIGDPTGAMCEKIVEGFGTEVADTECEHLAVIAELFHRGDNFIEGGIVAPPVNLEEVNVIGLESLEAFFTAGDGGLVVERGSANFVGDEHLVASTFDPSSDDFLGEATAVAGSGIDHGDTGVHRGMDCGDGILFILIAPHGTSGKGPGAERKFRNRKGEVG